MEKVDGVIIIQAITQTPMIMEVRLAKELCFFFFHRFSSLQPSVFLFFVQTLHCKATEEFCSTCCLSLGCVFGVWPEGKAVKWILGGCKQKLTHNWLLALSIIIWVLTETCWHWECGGNCLCSAWEGFKQHLSTSWDILLGTLQTVHRDFVNVLWTNSRIEF